MVERYYHIKSELDESIFLFGARKTGKSTLLESEFKGEIYFDLLNTDVCRRFRSRPALLYDTLKDKPEGTIVVIDEIPEIPELLNEIHRLIQKNGLRFVMCGSSARKLKRKGYNTLGGRAFPCYFYPFVSAELPEFDLEKALIHGMIPSHYLVKNPQKRLAAYIDIYLKEEIKQEALVRHLDGFSRFMDVAALSSSEIVNYNNIATDCGVSAKTVKEYFTILEDTLIGYMIPAYTKTVKRKVAKAPKFYYFDVGIYNYLMHRTTLTPGTPEYGHAFEHFVVQEMKAYMGYTHSREQLSYWHAYNGKEVDMVIGDARIGIEIKAVEEVMNKHLGGLKEFGEEYPDSRRIIVSRDPFTRRIGDIECIYIHDWLKMLWNNEIRDRR